MILLFFFFSFPTEARWLRRVFFFSQRKLRNGSPPFSPFCHATAVAFPFSIPGPPPLSGDLLETLRAVLYKMTRPGAPFPLSGNYLLPPPARFEAGSFFFRTPSVWGGSLLSVAGPSPENQGLFFLPPVSRRNSRPASPPPPFFLFFSPSQPATLRGKSQRPLPHPGFPLYFPDAPPARGERETGQALLSTRDVIL